MDAPTEKTSMHEWKSAEGQFQNDSSENSKMPPFYHERVHFARSPSICKHTLYRFFLRSDCCETVSMKNPPTRHTEHQSVRCADAIPLGIGKQTKPVR